MTKNYIVLENGYIYYEENGYIVCFPNDESNPDYQAYLNKDKPQVEHLTEISTPDEA